MIVRTTVCRAECDIASLCYCFWHELQSERTHIEALIEKMVNHIGASERVVRSMLPPPYSIHTSRFLSVWCFTLPVVLVAVLDWLMIPVVVIICWSLFIIEEVAFRFLHFNFRVSYIDLLSENSCEFDHEVGIFRWGTSLRIHSMSMLCLRAQAGKTCSSSRARNIICARTSWSACPESQPDSSLRKRWGLARMVPRTILILTSQNFMRIGRKMPCTRHRKTNMMTSRRV